MLNPMLKEIYTDAMIQKLKEMADELEPKGVRALICYVDVYENGFACPGMIFVDLPDKESVDYIYKFFDYKWIIECVGHGDCLPPVGCPLSDVSSETQGVELWVR